MLNGLIRVVANTGMIWSEKGSNACENITRWSNDRFRGPCLDLSGKALGLSKQDFLLKSRDDFA